MFNVNNATFATQQTCTPEDETPCTQANDLGAVCMRSAQIVKRFIRQIQAPWQLAADHNQIVHVRGLAKGCVGRDGYTATGFDWLQIWRGDGPLAIDLPAKIGLVCGVAKAVNEARKRHKGEAGRQNK